MFTRPEGALAMAIFCILVIKIETFVYYCSISSIPNHGCALLHFLHHDLVSKTHHNLSPDELHLQIVILMWTGNNVTRPFRVAGAAALAPVIDKGLKKIQRYFKFSNTVYAFALVAAMIASVCGTVVGLLILSRWGR